MSFCEIDLQHDLAREKILFLLKNNYCKIDPIDKSHQCKLVRFNLYLKFYRKCTKVKTLIK